MGAANDASFLHFAELSFGDSEAVRGKAAGMSENRRTFCLDVMLNTMIVLLFC